jgi:hypothetical protein
MLLRILGLMPSVCMLVHWRSFAVGIFRFMVSRLAQSVRAGRLGDRDSIPGRGKRIFSSNLCVQTGSGAHPASCTMGTEGPFPEGKARPGHDADHSLPSSGEVENE